MTTVRGSAESTLGQGAGNSTKERSTGVFRLAFEVFLTNRLALVGIGITVFMVLFCFLGPVFYHTDQIHTNLMAANEPPSRAHLLGTTTVGRDELGSLMLGGQSSLEIGLLVALIATGFGVLWGAVAGFVGGVVDAVMMRIVDVFLSLPALFILIFLSTVVRPTIVTMALVVSFIAWLGPAILVVATLSFLGLGIPPPAANWGGMLSDGLTYIYDGYWWLIYPAGIAIVLTVVAFNFVGDALREALEVRLQRH